MDLDQLLREYRVDYKLPYPLDIERFNSDPIIQLQTWIQDAFDAKIPELNAMTLSTVSLSEGVCSRIVLLRALTLEGLVFYTNYQSQKGQEIANNANVAANFFWQPLSRQVRVHGKAVELSSAQSDLYFQARPRENQIAAWASPQSQPMAHRDELEKEFKKIEEKFAGVVVLPRPVFWGGYCIRPEYIEFWQGNQHRLHDRICYRLLASSQWERARLAP